MCSFNIVRIEENAGLRFGGVVIIKPENISSKGSKGRKVRYTIITEIYDNYSIKNFGAIKSTLDNLLARDEI